MNYIFHYVVHYIVLLLKPDNIYKKRPSKKDSQLYEPLFYDKWLYI